MSDDVMERVREHFAREIGCATVGCAMDPDECACAGEVLATVKALHAAGLAVVPRQATPLMLHAARNYGCIRKTVEQRWDAMLRVGELHPSSLGGEKGNG